MRDVLELRLGPTPGSLSTLSESIGWLGDPTSGEIAEPAEFRGDPGAASWLPSLETAERWDHFARATGPTAATIRLHSPPTLREEGIGYLSAAVRDVTGAPVWDPLVTFTSDREDVARVEMWYCNWWCDVAVGRVTALSEGQAGITAAYGADAVTATLTVLPAGTVSHAVISPRSPPPSPPARGASSARG